MNYNGHDFSDLLVVEDIRRQLMPTVENVMVSRSGADGSYFVRTTYGSRVIEVDIRLIESDRGALQAAVRTLAGMFYSRTPARLELHDEPDMYEMAVLAGPIDVDRFLYTGGATLTFVSPEPASYDNDEQVIEIGQDDIVNGGTYPAWGMITVTMEEAVPYLEVTQVGTGETVRIEHDFEANDVVEIDMDAETVTKNGSSIMADVTLASDFFEFPVGTFQVSVTSGKAILRYRKRWM